jgi:hypothetical protein
VVKVNIAAHSLGSATIPEMINFHCLLIEKYCYMTVAADDLNSHLIKN